MFIAPSWIDPGSATGHGAAAMAELEQSLGVEHCRKKSRTQMLVCAGVGVGPATRLGQGYQGERAEGVCEGEQCHI